MDCGLTALRAPGRSRAGLTALAIIPCIVLVRAERAARAAKRDIPPSPDTMAEALAA
jgi:hypothetical protein